MLDSKENFYKNDNQVEHIHIGFHFWENYKNAKSLFLFHLLF
jgi:hypothetical protein